MEYVVLLLALALAAYFCLRFFLLRRSLRAVDEELREVMAGLAENRIVKLPRPDRGVEQLLKTINELLDTIRQESIRSAHREADLKAQVEYLSHDLRTPLTSLQGYLSFIDATTLDEEGRESLAVVKRKAQTLQRLIAQFYELSRLESSEASFDLRLHDVGRILREAMVGHAKLLEERSLAVSVSIPECPVEARVDADALERVFANLLQNAGRYAKTRFSALMEVRESQIKIIFSNDLEAGSLREDEVEKLFLPFYTSDSSRSQQRREESSGLGLSIARRLAEHLDAHLEAHLRAEDGDQIIDFVLTLPRVRG
jgi:signal transduction histidine kinase